MRVLVTGKSGQVASCLADKLAAFPEIELIFAARPELDLLSPASIVRCLADIKPDLIINPAAYTAVDKAEDERDKAFAINGEAPGILAQEAKKMDIGILHVSTDYVFDGTLDRPYVETDPLKPLGVYGASKLAGEQAVISANPNHTIVRTAWVFSPYGNNFVKTMLRLAKDRDVLRVVDDQIGNPTSAHDIAHVLLSIADARRRADETCVGQTYHFAGGVEASWCGFAREIFSKSKGLGGPHAEVEAIPSSDFPTKAKRPSNSRLNSSKLLTVLDLHLERTEMIQSDIIGRIVAEL